MQNRCNPTSVFDAVKKGKIGDVAVNSAAAGCTDAALPPVSSGSGERPVNHDVFGGVLCASDEL